MVFYKHNYIGGNLPNSTQYGSMAIMGGFEQSVFQDDTTGYKIFWQFDTIFRGNGNIYIITAQPVDGSDAGIYNVTIQASAIDTGEVLGTCKIPSGINEIGNFSHYYQSAECKIFTQESNKDNIMLEII